MIELVQYTYEMQNRVQAHKEMYPTLQPIVPPFTTPKYPAVYSGQYYADYDAAQQSLKDAFTGGYPVITDNIILVIVGLVALVLLPQFISGKRHRKGDDE
jgi:hypothetical protein